MASLNNVVFGIKLFSIDNTNVIHISMLDPAVYYLHKEITWIYNSQRGEKLYKIIQTQYKENLTMKF